MITWDGLAARLILLRSCHTQVLTRISIFTVHVFVPAHMTIIYVNKSLRTCHAQVLTGIFIFIIHVFVPAHLTIIYVNRSLRTCHTQVLTRIFISSSLSVLTSPPAQRCKVLHLYRRQQNPTAYMSYCCSQQQTRSGSA